MRSLRVLQRLAKQAVDRERQVLQTITSEITAVETAIEACLHSIDHETAKPLDFMTSGITLSAFIGAEKARVQALKTQLAHLQQRHEAQIERVRQERTEQKRFERITERREQEAALEEEAKQQKVIDELVNAKWGRR